MGEQKLMKKYLRTAKELQEANAEVVKLKKQLNSWEEQGRRHSDGGGGGSTRGSKNSGAGSGSRGSITVRDVVNRHRHLFKERGGGARGARGAGSAPRPGFGGGSANGSFNGGGGGGGAPAHGMGGFDGVVAGSFDSEAGSRSFRRAEMRTARRTSAMRRRMLSMGSFGMCLLRAADAMKAAVPRRRVRVCINGKWTTVSPWVSADPLQRLVPPPPHVPLAATGHVVAWQDRGLCTVRSDGDQRACVVTVPMSVGPGGAPLGPSALVWFEFAVEEPNTRATFSLRCHPFDGGISPAVRRGLERGDWAALPVQEWAEQVEYGAGLGAASSSSSEAIGATWSGDGRSYGAGSAVRGIWTGNAEVRSRCRRRRCCCFGRCHR